jgi:DNA-binding SARP family transcriptional activator
MKASVRRPGSRHCTLALLDGFHLVVDGSTVSLPIHAQRVLAYLALPGPHSHALQVRSVLAGRLWSDVTSERAAASLRTALWRIGRADPQLVQASRGTVRLGEAVEVDVRRCVAQANRLLADRPTLLPQDIVIDTLCGDLLPTWDEDWLLLEREKLRQVQIHALEALARHLCRLGRLHEAIGAAYAAIEAEPLRESAHATLIDVFLAEGNRSQARRHLDRYDALLWSELGLRPAPALTARVAQEGPSPPGVPGLLQGTAAAVRGRGTGARSRG